MSISPSITSLAGLPWSTPGSNPAERVEQALNSLWSALASGDAASAAKSFASLQGQMQSNTAMATLLSNSPQAQQALRQLGEPIRNGQTAVAQEAYPAARQVLAEAVNQFMQSAPRTQNQPNLSRSAELAEDRAEFSSATGMRAGVLVDAGQPRAGVMPGAVYDPAATLYALPQELQALNSRVQPGGIPGIPSALAAQEAMRLAAQVNPLEPDEWTAGRPILQPWMLLIPATALLLWFIL